MTDHIGTIRALYRYPVKSMAGERLTSAPLGWHGIEGDRRFAFMRAGDPSGFPWLTASKLPEMIRYRPLRADPGDPSGPPTHVITPRGDQMELRSEALQRELSEAHRRDVHLVQLDQGVFDHSTLSVISAATVTEIERRTGRPLDERRFRPNIVIETAGDTPFPEDAWVGRILVFGERNDSPAMGVALRDLRCVMINLDPDTGASDPVVLKSVVQANESCAGVYGSTLRVGTVSIGDRVWLAEI